MKSTQVMVISVLFLVLVYSGLSIGNSTEDALVAIDAGNTVGHFNHMILGSNINWVNNCDGLFDAASGGIKKEAFQMIKDLGIKIIRFPGGNLSEYYDWKSGIGAHSKRGLGLDYEKKPQKMNCGIDDFLRFCDMSDIVPVITVGFSNNTPGSAAEIVEYCNGSIATPMGALRARNGHPSPYSVKYWELGNEVYTKGMTADKASAYGKKASEIAVKMKEVDPSIKIGAIGLGVNKVWDMKVLEACSQQIDFLIYHRYFPNTTSDDPVQTNNAIIACTGKMMREIKRLKETAAAYNPELAVAVTEYNLDFRDPKWNFINKRSDVQQALFIAECIRLFELNGVLFATKWDLSNFSRNFMSDINFNRDKEVTLAPSYYAQRIFAKSGIEAIVSAKVVSPTVSVIKYGEITNENNAPIITALAGKDRTGKKLTIILINRDLYKSFKTKINIQNFGNANKIVALTLKGSSLSPNDQFQTETKNVDTNALAKYELPAGSISMLTISK